MTSDAQISDREREILRLVATGATNQQIAQQLNISTNTVKVHLRNIFSKIGAASRTEATLYAVRTGLVRVGETPAPSALTETLVAPQGTLATEETTAAVAVAPPTDAPAKPDVPTATGDSGLAPPLMDAPPIAIDRDEPAIAPARSPSRRWLLAVGSFVIVVVLAGLVFTLTRSPGPTVQPTTTAPTGVGLAP